MDTQRHAVHGSYAATFSERQRGAQEVPSPRSGSRAARSGAVATNGDGARWNKSVRVAVPQTRGSGDTSPRQQVRPPTSPTARRFRSPQAGSPREASTASSQPGPSVQTRSLFMHANDLVTSTGPMINVAATVASTPRSAASQAELVKQLRDVVLKLTQGAAAESQEAAHIQQRFDAYTELVREQDRIINELRMDNARLQRERDTLLEFRHQSLQRDMKLLSTSSEEHASLTKTPLLDELIQREFAKSNGLTSSAAASLLTDALTPPTRNLVRSLAAQLYDERTRRLDVEERSSALVGQQQSMIDTLELRLQRAERTPQRTPRRTNAAAAAWPAVADGGGARTPLAGPPVGKPATPQRGGLDSPTLSSSTSPSSSSSSPRYSTAASPDSLHPRRESDPMNSAQRRVVDQLSHRLENPSRGGATPSTVPRAYVPLPISPRGDTDLSHSRTPVSRLRQSSRDATPPLSPSEAYDDANTILSAIRQKYGL